jgi:flagellar basal body-associated protein FliL
MTNKTNEIEYGKKSNLIFIIILLLLPLLIAGIIIYYTSMQSKQLPLDKDDIFITAQIKSRIQQDKELTNLPVQVTSHQGEVELTGTVANNYEEQKIVDIAMHVRCTSKINDELQVQHS